MAKIDFMRFLIDFFQITEIQRFKVCPDLYGPPVSSTSSQTTSSSTSKQSWLLAEEFNTKLELETFFKLNEFKCAQMHG